MDVDIVEYRLVPVGISGRRCGQKVDLRFDESGFQVFVRGGEIIVFFVELLLQPAPDPKLCPVYDMICKNRWKSSEYHMRN